MTSEQETDVDRMSDVSEQAKALARAVWPYVERHSKWHTEVAQRAIDAGWVQRAELIAELEAQGWTPPPDPPLTDAERVAKAWLEAEGRNWEGAQWPEPIRKAQVLIDSGLITVVSPPDPWEAIARKLYRSLPLTMQEWDSQRHAQQADLLDAVRDLLTEDEARAIARSAIGPDSKDGEYVARWEALALAGVLILAEKMR